MAKIPIFYRIFFLYIDPLICLSGIYLMFFDHHSFLQNGTPGAISSLHPPGTDLPPTIRHLISSFGAVFTFFFVIEVILLQAYKNDLKLWRIVEFGILVTDLLMGYGIYSADPAGALDLSSWGTGDWGNNGILALVIVMRSAFLLGIGGVRA